MTEQPGCNNCKHWHGGMVCDAYPKGIPWPIMAGDVAHFEPLDGDNGLQFEQNDEEVSFDIDVNRDNENPLQQ